MRASCKRSKQDEQHLYAARFDGQCARYCAPINLN
jgi:hypothetical protein